MLQVSTGQLERRTRSPNRIEARNPSVVARPHSLGVTPQVTKVIPVAKMTTGTNVLRTASRINLAICFNSLLGGRKNCVLLIGKKIITK